MSVMERVKCVRVLKNEPGWVVVGGRISGSVDFAAICLGSGIVGIGFDFAGW